RRVAAVLLHQAAVSLLRHHHRQPPPPRLQKPPPARLQKPPPRLQKPPPARLQSRHLDSRAATSTTHTTAPRRNFVVLERLPPMQREMVEEDINEVVMEEQQNAPPELKHAIEERCRKTHDEEDPSARRGDSLSD
uniref:GAGE domain-containing protein n=1 Tax=Haemonchus contortus TaxID=6289 RepID=A0A7I4YEB1_HAECO